jgi:hypothetical protein
LAEIERKKTSEKKNEEKSPANEQTAQKVTSPEERMRKLQKLKELKQKLEEMEKKDQVSTDKIVDEEVWIPPGQQVKTSQSQNTAQKVIAKQTSNQSKANQTSGEEQYLQEIDEDLSNLEKEISSGIDESKYAEMMSEEDPLQKTMQSIDILSNKVPQEKLSAKDLSEVDNELVELQKQISSEKTKTAIVVSIFDKLCEEHQWIILPENGFMYSMPDKKKNKQDFDSWLDDWTKVLFDYARIACHHIIYSMKLLSEKPWSDFKDRSSAIQELTDGLVKQQVAEWLDKKKERLRVYWKSLENWADAILEWAENNAFTEPLFIQDIRQAGEIFSTLPDEDILKAFNIISNRGRAEKIKLKTGETAITIKF